MQPKFVDQPLVPEIVVFFALLGVWSAAGLMAALSVASLADLAISALAWRMSRRQTVEIPQDHSQ